MSNSYDKSSRSSFFSGAVSAGSVQKEFIEAPMAAAGQPAIKAGLDLLAFMSAMPDVFLASEQRELRRLARTSDNKDDPRIERLKVSIERASELSNTANLGKARIDRAITALSNEEDVFHGFVSDTNLKPREKLTVRISAFRSGNNGGDKEPKSFSATTDADGYFSISLGKERNDHRKTGTYESTVKLSEQMAERLASVNAKGKAKTAAGTSGTYTPSDNSMDELARVEILDASGKVLLQDSSPLLVNAGTAYREYVVEGDGAVKSYENAAAASTAPNAPVSARKKATAAKKPVSGKTKK